MDWGELEKIRRSPDPGCWCFLAIIRVYFIASAIRLRNCLVPSHAREWSFGAVPPQERRHEGFLFFVLGGFFHTLRSGHAAPCRHGSGRHPALRRGRRGGIGFILVPSLLRRHACFFLEVAPLSGGEFFHTLRAGQARMPPVDRQHEGFRFLRRREGAGNSGMTAVWG